MRRINNTEIIITQSELDNIRDFIRSELASQWNSYTETFIDFTTSDEDGMRRMDPDMYDMAQQMDVI
jgi:hypothetical protein